MSNSRQEYKISDAPIEIIDGDRGKNYPKQNEFYEDGYCLFLNANNVTKEGFLFNSMQFITKEKDELLRSGKLRRGDIVLTTRGTIGNVVYYNDNVPLEHVRINSGMVIFRCNQDKIIPGFLFQFMRSPFFHAQINALKSGVAQPQLPICDIKYMTIPIPSLTEQLKISSILSAYDDLIENNTRRIKILEEIAQRIYREWFVDFRFPTHPNPPLSGRGYKSSGGRMIDSELGKIPEGWEIVETGIRFTTVLGGTPSRFKDEYWDKGTIPWIQSSKINETRIIDESEFITELGLQNSSTKMMPKRTTVVAITGATLGQVSMLEIETCANQSVVGIYDKENIFNEYIYYKFCEIIESIILKAGGGAQQHINKEIINAEKFSIPPIEIINIFNQIICPICDLIRNLLIRNKNLKTTRDLLLPKLISGELDVENLAIAIRQNGDNK